MISFKNSFESGAAGVAITAGQSGNSAAPGEYLGSALAVGANTLTYSQTCMHGSLAARLKGSGGAQVHLGYDDPTTPMTTTAMRGYFRWEAFPTSSGAGATIMWARGVESGNTGYLVRTTTTNALQLVQPAAASAQQLLGTTAPLSLNTWYRIEVRFTRTGEWGLRLYKGDSYVLEGAEMAGTGGTSGTAAGFTQWRWSMDSATAVTGTQYVDDIAYGDDWIGPAASPESRPVAMGSASGWTAKGNATLQVALSDGSDTTYAESPGLTSVYQPAAARLGIIEDGDLVVRARLSGDNKPKAMVRLLQGTSVVVATWTVTDVPATATDYTFSLDAFQAAKITDRSNLWVDVAGVV